MFREPFISFPVFTPPLPPPYIYSSLGRMFSILLTLFPVVLCLLPITVLISECKICWSLTWHGLFKSGASINGSSPELLLSLNSMSQYFMFVFSLILKLIQSSSSTLLMGHWDSDGVSSSLTQSSITSHRNRAGTGPGNLTQGPVLSTPPPATQSMVCRPAAGGHWSLVRNAESQAPLQIPGDSHPCKNQRSSSPASPKRNASLDFSWCFLGSH